MTPDRLIRVFISSTFLDMRAERDELVKRVFPELRKLCESRGVTWGEVDLRWGITDEQKAEGQVLPVCLAEIRNCHPYFIGILGERYGWDRVEMAPDLIRAEPWLEEHLRDKTSVTELEILHGVLNDPSMAGQAFFYFRDPAYARAHGLIEGPTTNDLPELGAVEATARSETRRRKLAALKQRIRQAHHDGKLEHAPREGFADPAALADLVRADLRGVIDRLFPEDSAPDALAREAAEHEAFARSRARVYVGRPKLYAALDAHAAGDGPPLVVLGESGAGKSALLANWARRLRAAGASTSATGAGAPFVIEHYIGATPASTDWAAMCRRVLEEMSRRFELKLEIPDKPEALRAAFVSGLYRAAVVGRVVLVLDGLNQLEDQDQAPDLGWLPPEVPPNVRLVVATLPGRSLDALKQRDWPTLTVNLLSVEERRALIPFYLRQYGKELSTVRIERLAKAAETASPLYLRTLLEELRQWGDHATIEARITHYLEAPTPKDLFAKVLERWEHDFERGRPGLVRDVMVGLWAARRGLSEVELLDILGKPGPPGEPLPRAHWSPLHLAADAALVSRSGLLAFAHHYLRQAVEARYLSVPDAQRCAHSELADYFAGQTLGARKVDELPWQLARAEAWQRLYDLLAEPAFFVAAWAKNQFEVKSYWTEIEARSPLRLVQAYARIIDGTEGGGINWELGQLLRYAGHLDEAFATNGRLVDYCRATGNLQGLQGTLGNQAVTLQVWGRLEEAMALLKEQEGICRQLGKLDNLQGSLANQAEILRVRGQLDEAMALLAEQERISRQLGDLHGLEKAFGAQALILADRGQPDEAMALHKEKERICRQLGDLDGLAASLGNRALILQARGRFDEAVALYKEGEHICRQLGNLDGLQASLGNQAVILTNRGKLDEAIALNKEQERICRQLKNLDALQAGLGNQAWILYLRGQLDEALALLEEQERICRQLASPASLQKCLGNRAFIFRALGRLDEAMALHKEEERICRQLANPDSLQRSLGNQGLILQALGRLDEAMALHKEQERICRQLDIPLSLQECLGGQATILYRQGRFDEAMVLLKEQERLCRRLGNPDSLQTSLGSQALILRESGQLEAAMDLHKEEERIYRQLGNLDGIQISLGNQAVILQMRGQLDDAMALLKEKERICRQLGNVKSVGTSLGNQAVILQMRGQLDDAMALHMEAERICRQLRDSDGLQAILGNRAVILQARGQLEEAMGLLKEQERICRQLRNPGGLQASLGNQALVLRQRGQLDDAMARFKEQESICRQLGTPDNLATSLINQALVLRDQNRARDALPLAQEALRLAGDHHLTALARAIKPIVDKIRAQL